MEIQAYTPNNQQIRYTVLCSAILYCIVVYHTIQYRTVLYYTTLYCTVLLYCCTVVLFLLIILIVGGLNIISFLQKILLRESSGQIIDVSPQPVSGFGKVKSSPKDTKSPKRSQKGTTPRIPKSTRSTGKKGGSRKLQHTSQTPIVSQLRPSPVSMTTGSQHSVDSDVERDPVESELPLLSTTFHKTSDDDHVSDLSSSDDNHMTFTSSFPPTRVTDLGEGYGFTEGPAPSSQWLSSNSNTSSDSD